MITAKYFLLIYFSRVSKIGKRLVPNLRRLQITLTDYTPGVEPDQLFDHDVLFSLTNFILLGLATGPDVIRNFLSMLCHQCSYSLMVRWYVEAITSLSDTSVILLNTFRQLQGRISIELELTLLYQGYRIEAFTVPRIDGYLCVDSFSSKNIVCGYVEICIFFLMTNCVFPNLDKVDGHLLRRS
jgi:hypothetical protein